MMEISFKFPDWAEKMRMNEMRVNLFLAAQVQFNRAMLFDNEGAYNGHKKWAPLKFRNGQILTRSGTLRKSIAPTTGTGAPGPDGIVRFEADRIIIGTKLGYARLMNDGTTKMPGGVLRPVKAKALKIPLPSGKSANNYTRTLRKASLERALRRAKKDLDQTAQSFSAALAKVKGGPSNARSMRQSKAIDRHNEKINAIQQKISRVMQTGKGGDDFIFRKWVKIPARPFDEWNAQDQDEIDGALKNLIVEILNGK